MKYREVYLALNQRKLDAPGFHYSDYSGWQAANQEEACRLSCDVPARSSEKGGRRTIFDSKLCVEM